MNFSRLEEVYSQLTPQKEKDRLYAEQLNTQARIFLREMNNPTEILNCIYFVLKIKSVAEHISLYSELYKHIEFYLKAFSTLHTVFNTEPTLQNFSYNDLAISIVRPSTVDYTSDETLIRIMDKGQTYSLYTPNRQLGLEMYREQFVTDNLVALANFLNYGGTSWDLS